MPSTTIKLGPDLIAKARAIMPEGSSVSACVRGLIEREYRERRLREASHAYNAFLANNPQERASMQVWEAAPFSVVDSIPF